jgi:hypothetical protein
MKIILTEKQFDLLRNLILESSSGNIIEDLLEKLKKHISDLLKRYEGRVDLAVASYNSGPNLKKYKETYNSDMSFVSLKGKIPGETYKYASTILQA